MIAIETKYLGPTNTRGSRIKAYTDNGHSLTIGYPHELDTRDAHAKAAVQLARSLGWDGDLIAGGTTTGYVFVFSESDRYPINLTDADRENARRVRQERMDATIARLSAS